MTYGFSETAESMTSYVVSVPSSEMVMSKVVQSIVNVRSRVVEDYPVGRFRKLLKGKSVVGIGDVLDPCVPVDFT